MFLGTGGPAAAQAWAVDEGEHATALSNCFPHDAPPVQSCLSLVCFWDGQFRLNVLLRVARVPPQATSVLALDGAPAFTATFVDVTGTGSPLNFAAPISGDTLAALMDRMAGARAMSVSFDDPALNQPALAAIPLAGIGPPMAMFRDNCVDPLRAVMPGAAAPAPPAAAPGPDPGATPATDPARFPATATLADTGPKVADLARRLLAGPIAEGQALAGRPIEVLPELIRFADGRQLMVVLLCDPTYFGITGCETHVFTAPGAGTPFTASVSGMIGGGPYWLDLAVGAAGWPDILSQPHTGGGAYARMRWAGARYDICPQGRC